MDALKEYVEKHQKQGFSDSEIKDALLKAGHSESEIQKYFVTPTKIIYPTKPHSLNWTMILTVSALVVLILLVVFGFFMNSSYQFNGISTDSDIVSTEDLNPVKPELVQSSLESFNPLVCELDENYQNNNLCSLVDSQLKDLCTSEYQMLFSVMKNVPTECGQDDNFCNAANKLDVSYCQTLPSSNFCVNLVNLKLALKNNDVSYCDYLSSNYLKNDCRQIISEKQYRCV